MRGDWKEGSGLPQSSTGARGVSARARASKQEQGLGGGRDKGTEGRGECCARAATGAGCGSSMAAAAAAAAAARVRARPGAHLVARKRAQGSARSFRTAAATVIAAPAEEPKSGNRCAPLSKTLKRERKCTRFLARASARCARMCQLLTRHACARAHDGTRDRLRERSVEFPSLRELRMAIPKACFQPSTATSLAYAACDLALLAACALVARPFALAHPALLPLYWAVSGLVMWMVFVIGHDCGHGSFSRNPTLNAVVGHLCHTPLMVPFWPWAYSHKMHHKYHNHRTRDMSHKWWTREEYADVHPLVRALALDTPLGIVTAFPGYLLLEGKRCGTDGSHFWPGSRLFDRAPKERKKCAVSSALCVAFLAGTAWASGSAYAFLAGYVGPYAVFSWWLFTVTYLQHHDDDTIAYEEGEWEYVKGACQTVDREFGAVIDGLTHRITSDHVAHHIFSDMPHYRLPEATAAVRAVLEPLGVYKRRDTRDYVREVLRVHERYGHCLESPRPRAFAFGPRGDE